MQKENTFKIVKFICFLALIYFLPFIYQKAKLGSEKRFEVFKFCVDSVPKDKYIDFNFLKLQFGACDSLSNEF